MNADNRAEYCYIGSWPACGCIRFITSDKPEYAKDTGKKIGKLIRDGYAVNRILIADFKAGKHGTFGCKAIKNHEYDCPNPNNPARPKRDR